jgi:hypothetical protein
MDTPINQGPEQWEDIDPYRLKKVSARLNPMVRMFMTESKSTIDDLLESKQILVNFLLILEQQAKDSENHIVCEEIRKVLKSIKV